MVVLLLLLCGLTVLAAYQGPPEATGHGWTTGRMMLGVLLVLAGSCAVGLACAPGPNLRGMRLARAFRYWQRLHALLWFGLICWLLFAGQWGRVVRYDWRLHHLPGIQQLLLLLPVWLPLMLWALVESMAQERRFSLAQVLPAVALRLRLDGVLVLLPVWLLWSLRDGISLLNVHPAWGLVPCWILLLAYYPEWFRRLWDTEPLPAGPLRHRLVRVCRRLRVPLTDILIWRTDERLANAAIAGFVPWCRYLLLSDGLLRRLSEVEVEAVVRHELAHIRRRHLWWRLAAIVLPAAAATAVDAALHPDAPFGSPDATSDPLTLAVAAGMILTMVISLGVTSWVMEFDADRYACLEPTASPAGPLALATALRKITAPGTRRRGGWLHPSPQTRIRRLIRMARTARRQGLHSGMVAERQAPERIAAPCH